MTTTTKAIRANIIIGDIELECYKLVHTNCGFHFTQLALETLQIKLGSPACGDYVKTQLVATGVAKSLVYIGQDKVVLKLIPQFLFIDIVSKYAQEGNKSCLSMLIACLSDKLEALTDYRYY
jgi:hypothetical protein